jgi:CRISPR-associated protein Cmr2
MPSPTYTAITFAPVQGFIEKSRKLRDLYGSSYLLSFLSWAVCYRAELDGYRVISPAQINVAQGLPNQIVIQGSFPEDHAREAFEAAWSIVVNTCREWIEQRVEAPYQWQRDWGHWANYAWEFFWGQGEAGESVSQVRQRLNAKKRPRGWTGVNWTGESSTLSGADAVAWPKLGVINPRNARHQDQKGEIRVFYQALGQQLEAFIDPNEELSVPELVKRIVTHEAVANTVIAAYEAHLENHLQAALEDQQKTDLIAIALELNPRTFRDLNRKRTAGNTEPKYWTGWFQGDGDGAGEYLKALEDDPEEAEKLHRFSDTMRQWGLELKHRQGEILGGNGRMIYAGGDDFLGVLYRPNEQIQPTECWDFFSTFDSRIWRGLRDNDGNPLPPKPIGVSVGFVWAAPNVPQRDVLQHCREAERSAKQQGKDRIAFRIVFNGGNTLEWACPWWALETGHIDISQNHLGLDPEQAWLHFYNDVAALEARHGFGGKQDGPIDVAAGLFRIYFGDTNPVIEYGHWWNPEQVKGSPRRPVGLLGSPQRFGMETAPDSLSDIPPERMLRVRRAFNQWVISLAKVGFHLCRPARQPQPVAP